MSLHSVASKIIPAGEKKARLTLADGTEVHVEEVTAQMLQEEGVNIEYTRMGRLFTRNGRRIDRGCL